jgi:hypothetical protein
VNAQKIAKMLLLLFAVASLFALILVPDEASIINETTTEVKTAEMCPVTSQGQTTEALSSTGATAQETPEIATSAAVEPAAQKAPETTLVISYYHGSARCVSCRTIEAFAAEAVQKFFQPQLQSGKIKWQEVNVQTPENSHYIKHYQLFSQSVILSLQKNGDEVKWKNLDQVWQLIRDQEQFHAYIKKEAEAMLAEENKS